MIARNRFLVYCRACKGHYWRYEHCRSRRKGWLVVLVGIWCSVGRSREAGLSAPPVGVGRAESASCPVRA